MTVRLLLRPRLDQAMEDREALPRRRLRLFLLFDAASFMRRASMGDTFPAGLAGRRQERRTVIQANRAEPMKMTGLADTVLSPSRIPRKEGTSTMPSSQPNSSPRGIPIRQMRPACPKISRRIWRLVVPRVFSLP